MCLGWNKKHGLLIFKICGWFSGRGPTQLSKADGGQYVCFDWGVMDAGWGATGVRTSARLASESAPVWNDSSQQNRDAHILMTTAEITAHIKMFMGSTKQCTSVDDAD